MKIMKLAKKKVIDRDVGKIKNVSQTNPYRFILKNALQNYAAYLFNLR